MSALAISVLIADDHELVREGIKARLALSPNMKVCGEAANGREAINASRWLTPDVVFLDISMPGMTGLEAAPKILEVSPKSRILFLSMYDNPEYVKESLRVGARGYMLKDVTRQEMAAAVEAVYRGGTYLGPNVGVQLDAPDREAPASSAPFNLTERESQILTMIAGGAANREIADRLEISVRTVESHRLSIRSKTGGGNAADLFRIARELGLV